ncbi:MAG: tRNA preQ1(34) S-adenosylmethionine ribosyltransferase-isomerase QueA [Mollicutes bacterium]|jgi:S-adenosylmethionine:tRNA ribosyltransferase-isomerase|nr:tRNA preQ1(34) S-adenosylmethionine ribosyltransferase-isomerase QueA [Mollicutes bacterium]
MKVEDFNYELDNSLIAQTPLLDRSSSKLMILNKNTGEIKHEIFTNIIDYLNDNDVLVINDTKVIPARLVGSKEGTGAVIELLLLQEITNDEWECLAKPTKRLNVGTVICFKEKLKAEVKEIIGEGIVVVKLLYQGILLEILDELGEMPLPPYIHEKLTQKDRYQTVYAKNIGSAAAPTAGFHFTDELLTKIQEKNIQIVNVTLHVGLGTFRPVQVEDIMNHEMHSEFYQMNENAASILNQAKKSGKRIIAVGTTTTRVLETIMSEYHEFKKCFGNTKIFIYPGYKFRAIDALITNFHLPKSTLLMLVSAFSTKEIILKAYKEAIKNNYRFFSFGDAMFIK